MPLRTVSCGAAVLAALLLVSCGSATKRQPSQGSANTAQEVSNAQASNEDASTDPVEQLNRIQTETEDYVEAARGRDVSDAWARKMIEHQKGAIRLAQLLVQHSSDQRLRDLALSTTVQARQNIRALEAATENSLFKGDDLDVFVRPQLDMFAAMTIPNEKTFEQTWTAKMIAFHRGAVSLAGVAINAGDDGHAKELARQIAEQQANDAEALQRTAGTRDSSPGKRPT
jgi:uncharacterized protein (DUF305 family)